MPRSLATLATGLAGLEPTLSNSGGAGALASAYVAYMAEAQALTPILPASLAAAETAMKAAMSFPAGGSASSGGGVIRDGLIAFWGVLQAAPATYFAGATIIARPSFSSVQSGLAATFDDNRDQARSLSEAALELATVIHSASAGGTVTTAGPTVTAIA